MEHGFDPSYGDAAGLGDEVPADIVGNGSCSEDLQLGEAVAAGWVILLQKHASETGEISDDVTTSS